MIYFENTFANFLWLCFSFPHAGPNFLNPVPGTTCHAQFVGCVCANLLAKDLGV